MSCGTELCWQLLYTKPRAETWGEINLRRQGYATLYPSSNHGEKIFWPLCLLRALTERWTIA